MKTIVSALGLAGLFAASAAHATDGHVQRQLQWREQQAAELRLKMQQQQDRAFAVTPRAAHVDLQLQQVEIEQRQRLEQAHEEARRQSTAHGGTAPDVGSGHRGRAGDLGRLGEERQIEAARSASRPQAIR